MPILDPKRSIPNIGPNPLALKLEGASLSDTLEWLANGDHRGRASFSSADATRLEEVWKL